MTFSAMQRAYLSSIGTVPLSYFIYSSLSFFAPVTNDEISGPWFVRAITSLGRTEDAVRMELFRMERDGELHSRKEGRVKFYRPTPAAQAEIAAGSRKIFEDQPRRWNGKWTLVHSRFTRGQRAERERLRSLLDVEGYGPLGDGAFIHPRPPSAAFLSAIKSLSARNASITLFTAATLAERDAREVVSACWDLYSVSRRYERFIKLFTPLARTKSLSDSDAFTARFAVVFEYLQAAWADPELPEELLPSAWPATKARTLARSLYTKLKPAALRYAHEIQAS